MIYQGSPAKHLRDLAGLIKRKLGESTRCLYLNSPAMVVGMRSYLAAAGVDIGQEAKKGALVLSSEQHHLINGRFDVDRMLGLLADAVNQASQDGYENLWASGDITWEFGQENNFDKLLEYEYGLEQFFSEASGAMRQLPATSRRSSRRGDFKSALHAPANIR